jgi:hypothetical protein
MWELPISLLNQASHVHLWMSGFKLRRRGYLDTANIKDIEKQLGL